MQAGTITVNIAAPITRTPTSLVGASNATIALVKYGRLIDGGADAIIVKRTDHPHVSGDYFYAIRRDDKHAWTPGETILTANEITDLWYAEDCPQP
jgi:hypothetical protein